MQDGVLVLFDQAHPAAPSAGAHSGSLPGRDRAVKPGSSDKPHSRAVWDHRIHGNQNGLGVRVMKHESLHLRPSRKPPRIESEIGTNPGHHGGRGGLGLTAVEANTGRGPGRTPGRDQAGSRSGCGSGRWTIVGRVVGRVVCRVVAG